MRGTAQHSARFIEKRSTSLGQLDTAPDAVKQWHAMAPLQDELRPVFDDLELALWFVTPNDWLGGARPAFAMHHSLPAVLQAARADRFVAGGP